MTIKKKIKDNFKIIEEKYGQSNDIVKRNIKFQKKAPRRGASISNIMSKGYNM